MFYMFSGPDFLYADAFFPEATTYVMAGLEPPGQIPDLQKMPRGSLGPSLGSVARSGWTLSYERSTPQLPFHQPSTDVSTEYR